MKSKMASVWHLLTLLACARHFTAADFYPEVNTRPRQEINMSSCPRVISGEGKLNDLMRMNNVTLDRTFNIVNRNGKGITLLYVFRVKLSIE